LRRLSSLVDAVRCFATVESHRRSGGGCSAFDLQRKLSRFTESFYPFSYPRNTEGVWREGQLARRYFLSRNPKG